MRSNPLSELQARRQYMRRVMHYQLEHKLPLFCYPERLSGGKHENTFLCQSRLYAPQGELFVWKCLPVDERLSLHEIANPADQVSQPAHIEYIMYNYILQFAEQDECFGFPFPYAAFLVRKEDITSFITFYDQSDQPKQLTTKYWSDWLRDQKKRVQFLCLCIEYCPMTSFRNWIHKFSKSLKPNVFDEFTGAQYHGIPINWVYSWFSADSLSKQQWKPLWQSLFFQVMFNLAFLQDRLPHFRHLDLHFGNVLLYPLTELMIHQNQLRGPYYAIFKVRELVFYVPLTFLVQLFDFDFAHSALWRNTKVYSNQPQLATQHGVSPDTAAGYDPHLFFVPMVDMNVFDRDTLSFLKDVVPPGFRMNEKYTVGSKKETRFRAAHVPKTKELLSAVQILQHPYFENMRTPPKIGKLVPFVFSVGTA